MANRPRRLPNSKKSAPASRFLKFGNLKNLFSKLRQKIAFKKRYEKATIFAQKKPFTSFFISLGILLVVILLGSTIFGVKPPETAERTQPKNVAVFRIGETAKITLQGEVKKGGVITIVAQAPGIVASINNHEGDYVKKGKVLINLASNYQGGNAPALQRQLAGLTYQNTKATYDTQKDIIQKQRDVANLQAENSDKLRDITQVSINDTRDLLNLNNDIIDQIKTNIQTLQNSNASPSDILSLQQVLAQVQAGTNQLSAMQRANEYQNNTDNPPVEIQNITKDITLKQLDIQEKALNMSLQAAGISLKLAQVQEATMFPAAPFDGTVQKIHVKVGDSVNPGMPLITFSGNTGGVIIDVRVSKDVAQKVSKIEPATIIAGSTNISQIPYYISTDATSGQLYSVLFAIDDSYKELFTDSSYVPVTLALGHGLDTPVPFIPLDSVFQTQNEAYVYTISNGKAKTKKITLGDVDGGFVTVVNGLSAKDTVIIDRTVIDGDPVNVTN